jgi:hypothetical protein
MRDREGSFVMAYKGNALAQNGVLFKGDYLESPNGRYQAILQEDGNLVVCDLHASNKVDWQSSTDNKPVDNAIMQPDGNFVVYGSPEPEWASNTKIDVPCIVVMGDDGFLTVYKVGEQKWSSKLVSPTHP